MGKHQLSNYRTIILLISLILYNICIDCKAMWHELPKMYTKNYFEFVKKRIMSFMRWAPYSVLFFLSTMIPRVSLVPWRLQATEYFFVHKWAMAAFGTMKPKFNCQFCHVYELWNFFLTFLLLKMFNCKLRLKIIIVTSQRVMRFQ